MWWCVSGNIAHGAKVGANHTGRLPDQEAAIGEGVFFGTGTCTNEEAKHMRMYHVWYMYVSLHMAAFYCGCEHCRRDVPLSQVDGSHGGCLMNVFGLMLLLQ